LPLLRQLNRCRVEGRHCSRLPGVMSRNTRFRRPGP
jgi:hypothetical protein